MNTADSTTIDTPQVITYSEKSFAVIGNSIAIKNSLKKYGRYNRRLKVNNEITPGWIFSNKHIDTVKTIVADYNLTNQPVTANLNDIVVDFDVVTPNAQKDLF